MEFKLVSSKLALHLLACKEPFGTMMKAYSSESKLTFDPVIDEAGGTSDLSVDWTSSREITIKLLFGDSDVTRKLEMGAKKHSVHITTYLTLMSSNTGRLVMNTEPKTLDIEFNEVDILKELHQLQETLPPNSIEFNLSVSNLSIPTKATSLNSVGKGLKLIQKEQGGPVSLEMEDVHFPGDVWFEQWRDVQVSFIGWLELNLRLDMAAVTELYKKRFGRAQLANVVGTATDLVILVGGNKDKENAIKCHKSILSEMSPVFAAMFQTDMLEAKEGCLEIVDFSEAVIRALMEFVYHGNMEEALKSSDTALELLLVADKYQMKGFMENLLQIIWYMPSGWFSVEMVIKLVRFTKNAGEDLAQAESKGWTVLKWYAKMYPEKVMESKEIENLREDPRAMKEFVVQLLNKIT